MSSKTESYKAKVEVLTLRMQFFCLDPKLSNYKEISECIKLKNEQGENYNIWNLAVLAKYGPMWGIETPDDIAEKFNKESKRLSLILLLKPTASALDKIWYIFFAVGEVSALRAAFEVAGNLKASKELRENALKMFETFRDAYSDKIRQVLSEKPNFFTTHEIPSASESVGAFEKLNMLINKKTEELKNLDIDPLNNDIDNVLSRAEAAKANIVSQNSNNSESESESDFVSGSESEEETEKEKEKKKKLKEASNLFDDIAKTVMTKIKLGKK